MCSDAKNTKKIRQRKLEKLIEADPTVTDRDLAASLGVSVSTVRLDRAMMGIPELRERLRSMAQRAGSRLKSLSQSEIVGDLLELEPGKWALSILSTARDMVFRSTDIIWDHYIYSQASSIAVAAIDAAVVIIDSMHGEYKGHAKLGDTLIARAKVGTGRDGRSVVSVRTRVADKEIFVGRFIIKTVKN